MQKNNNQREQIVNSDDVAMNISKTQMAMFRFREKLHHSTSFKVLVISGIVGGLHALVNCLVQFIFFRSSPVYVFQFASSTLLGTSAFESGLSSVLPGIALYFVISFIFVSLFVVATSGIPVLARYPIVVGTVYGLLIWIIINLIVLPISASPPIDLAFVKVYINVLIYIGTIGIPITNFVSKFYSKSPTFRHF
jgi:hypothetical protein